jgi:hypothetical protein
VAPLDAFSASFAALLPDNIVPMTSAPGGSSGVGTTTREFSVTSTDAARVRLGEDA